jgi:hypothetical protein
MRSILRPLLNMTETSAQPSFAVKRNSFRVFFGVLGFAAILLSGCAARKKPSIPWGTAVLVHPILPQHPSPTAGVEVPPPDLGPEIPPPPLVQVGTRAAPSRPRIPAPATIQSVPPAKPDTPQIVPELSTQESTSLQRETDQSLAAAEHNLAATAGKSLNATQSDLASKVRSFISDAREAGRAGDWVRARDLAKKAQVLSEELAESL